MIDFFSVIEKKSMIEKISINISKIFGHPKNIFSIENYFDVEKKISADFFVNHFSLSKNKF